MSSVSLALSGFTDPHCNLAWIGKALAFQGSEDLLREFVEGLIDQLDFPKPLPHRMHGGGVGRHVCPKRSQWLRAGVLQWLNTYLPPDASAALIARERAKNADLLDQRAGNLSLVGGIDA